MNLNITKHIFISIVLLSVSSDGIEKLCQPVGQTLNYSPKNINLAYNAQEEFNNGIKVGKGSFGEVRECAWKYTPNTSAAIKRVEYSYKLYSEIAMMKQLEGLGFAPSFFGCQYAVSTTLGNNPKNKATSSSVKYVYIVQEMMLSDLDSRTSRDVLRDAPFSAKINFWLNIVTGLRKLNDMGYIHADIKPVNIMMNIEKNQIRMIDFGSVQKINGSHVRSGTPWFMTPTRHKCPENEPFNLPEDDLYALALTIAVVEGSYDKTFKKSQIRRMRNGVNIPVYVSQNECFSASMTPECSAVIFANTKKIFEKAGFGLYLKRESDPFRWNFTTLLLKMIDLTSRYKKSMEETQNIMHNIYENYNSIEKKYNNGLTVSRKIFIRNDDLNGFTNLLEDQTVVSPSTNPGDSLRRTPLIGIKKSTKCRDTVMEDTKENNQSNRPIVNEHKSKQQNGNLILIEDHSNDLTDTDSKLIESPIVPQLNQDKAINVNDKHNQGPTINELIPNTFTIKRQTIKRQKVLQRPENVPESSTKFVEDLESLPTSQIKRFEIDPANENVHKEILRLRKEQKEQALKLKMMKITQTSNDLESSINVANQNNEEDIVMKTLDARIEELEKQSVKESQLLNEQPHLCQSINLMEFKPSRRAQMDEELIKQRPNDIGHNQQAKNQVYKPVLTKRNNFFKGDHEVVKDQTFAGFFSPKAKKEEEFTYAHQNDHIDSNYNVFSPSSKTPKFRSGRKMKNDGQNDPRALPGINQTPKAANGDLGTALIIRKIGDFTPKNQTPGRFPLRRNETPSKIKVKNQFGLQSPHDNMLPAINFYPGQLNRASSIINNGNGNPSNIKVNDESRKKPMMQNYIRIADLISPGHGKKLRMI